MISVKILLDPEPDFPDLATGRAPRDLFLHPPPSLTRAVRPCKGEKTSSGRPALIVSTPEAVGIGLFGPVSGRRIEVTPCRRRTAT